MDSYKTGKTSELDYRVSEKQEWTGKPNSGLLTFMVTTLGTLERGLSKCNNKIP